MRGIIFLVAVALAGSAAAWVFQPRKLVLSLIVPGEELEVASSSYEFPKIPERVGAFTGAVRLRVEGSSIELSDADVTFFLDAGYPTSYFALERVGHYDADRFIDRWSELLALAQSLPDWRGNSSIVTDPADRAAALTLIEEMQPGRKYGNAKYIGLFSGRYRTTMKERPFFLSLTVNATYDPDRPASPYRLAIEQGTHAGSMACFSSNIDYVMAVKRGKQSEDGRGIEPELRKIFDEWDGQDASIRSLIERYVFDVCELNAMDWSDL